MQSESGQFRVKCQTHTTVLTDTARAEIDWKRITKRGSKSSEHAALSVGRDHKWRRVLIERMRYCTVSRRRGEHNSEGDGMTEWQGNAFYDSLVIMNFLRFIPLVIDFSLGLKEI